MGYKGNNNKLVSSSYLWNQIQALYTKIKGLLSNKSDVGHTHNYLPLSGGTMTGAIINSSTAGSRWIYGKTKEPKILDITTPSVKNGSRYDPLIRGKNTDGDIWNFGLGASNDVGFYGFKKERTESENGIDWMVSTDITTGRLTSSNGFAGDLYGNASTATIATTAFNAHSPCFKIPNNGNSNVEGGELELQNMDGNFWCIDSYSNKFRIFDNNGHVHFYLDRDSFASSFFSGTSDMVDGYHVVCNNGWGLKPIAAGTSALTPGTSALSTGNIYLQYE